MKKLTIGIFSLLFVLFTKKTGGFDKKTALSLSFFKKRGVGIFMKNKKYFQLFLFRLKKNEFSAILSWATVKHSSSPDA